MLSIVLLCVSRDDLYRVELDNMAGDEMFYSKVRLTHALKQKNIIMCAYTHNKRAGRSDCGLSPSRKGLGNPIRTIFECVG